MTEKKRYKVLLIGTSSPHIVNHLDRISNDIFDISVISNSKAHFGNTIEVDLVDFSMVKFWNFFVTPFKIANRIKIFQPDVIHVHQANSVALYTILGNKRKVPIVLTAWGSDILINPKKNIFLKWMLQYILKKVTICTSDSAYMATEMQKLVSKKLNIELCNFGVPESNISVIKENIIYSNRNHNPLYRIDKVISAFKKLIQSNPAANWKLIIGGKGSETQMLKDMVQNLGLSNHVEFIGFVDSSENARQYARAKFFISLPESDATAMSLLEAMYFKCVPILVDLPANKEWVENGVNGFIIENIEENFLEDIVVLDTDKMGEMNYSIIQKKGTLKISREKFKSVLLKAISK